MNSIHLMVITKIVINKKWNLIEIIEIYEMGKVKKKMLEKVTKAHLLNLFY